MASPGATGHAADFAGSPLSTCKNAATESCDPATPADSGYATADSTLQSVSDKSSSGPASQISVARIGRSRHKDLREFHVPVPPEVLAQYRRIAPPLQRFLVEYLQKRRQKHSPISMRLMVLGHLESDAKPWIVIFCNQDKEKHIKRFLKDDLVRKMCRPADTALPMFEVLVHPNGLLMLASTNMTLEARLNRQSDTLSGTSVRCSETMRYGVLGGLVTLKTTDELRVLGLVARHLLELEDHDVNDTSASSSDCSSVTDDDSPAMARDCSSETQDCWSLTWSDFPEILGEPHMTRRSDDVDSGSNSKGFDDFETGPRSPETHAMQDLVSLSRSASKDGTDSLLSHLEPLGVYEQISQGALEGPRDWALVTLAPEVEKQPNYLRPEIGLRGSRELHAMKKSDLRESQHVILNVESECHLTGRIGGMPSSIWLDKDAGFVEVLPLRMDSTEACEGYSGAWAVDPESRGVCGHLVARDTYLQHYVVPIWDVLNDIKELAKAEHVDVADTATLRGLDDNLLSREFHRPDLFSPMHPAFRNSSDSSYGSRASVLPSVKAEGESGRRPEKHPATFQCHQCPKKFTRGYILRSHLRTHHRDERPFVCTVCGQTFPRQHDRKLHERLHHSSEKKFVCRGELRSRPGQYWGCSDRFADVVEFARHIRSKTGQGCIEPLQEEEAAERRAKHSTQDGLWAQQWGFDSHLYAGTAWASLPAPLLAQYPDLQNVDWSQVPAPPADEGELMVSARSSTIQSTWWTSPESMYDTLDVVTKTAGFSDQKKTASFPEEEKPPKSIFGR